VSGKTGSAGSNMSHQAINSPRLPNTVEQFGVAGAILAGDTLYLSGQTPLDGAFNVIGKTFEAQTRAVFDAITAVLDEAGFTWNDMVKMTAFVHTENRSDIYTYCNILKEYLGRFSARSSIAHTYMLMSQMQVLGMMIEVDGIAVRHR
jgi:2-iminobutanoate/2-iminopropanoate deaminase